MPSPIDILYQNLYGSLPKKDGAAYERLAAAVCKLLAPHCEVFHDARIRGEFSKSFHQLDVQKTDGDETSFGEAKDYTADQRKVGRGDVQKLGGALGDLPVSKGIFFSATDYTKPALQYAAAAAKIVGKPIEPFHLRPAVEQDRDGRIETIRIQIHVQMPEASTWSRRCLVLDFQVPPRYWAELIPNRLRSHFRSSNSWPCSGNACLSFGTTRGTNSCAST